MKLLILILIFPLLGCVDEKARALKAIIDSCPEGGTASITGNAGGLLSSATTNCTWIVKND